MTNEIETLKSFYILQQQQEQNTLIFTQFTDSKMRGYDVYTSWYTYLGKYSQLQA